MISQWEKTSHGCWGRNGLLKKLNQASRRKKHTIKAFWWFKGDLISQWISKFYLCEGSNPINPQCGKISAIFYISHPPHPQFYPHKWWKFRYTSWLTPKNCISIDLRGAQVNNMKYQSSLRRRVITGGSEKSVRVSRRMDCRIGAIKFYVSANN